MIKSVLIDTWWNVNVVTTFKKMGTEVVLIDTWWNVNLPPSIVCTSVTGFNRYMVECEFGKCKFIIF